MTDPSDLNPEAGRTGKYAATQVVLIAVVVASALPELILQGADHGLWGTGRWRQTAYANGGFWAGLLRDWQPNYPVQPVTMFFTYGFLHAGLFHLILNMLTLMGLGSAVADRAGTKRFGLIYGISLLGGALGFATLSNVAQPMVGASGALFGLAGALSWWDYRDRGPGIAGLRPVMMSVLWLIVLNIVMWWAMDGLLAWQTHLGGFVAGGLAAALSESRRSPA